MATKLMGGGMPTEIEVARPDMLTCWKDIASYMGKGVRTVQRWERDLGLPVLRPDGVSHKSAVVADPRRLDEWYREKWSPRSHPSPPSEVPDDLVPFDVHGLRTRINTSHNLRMANHALMKEISTVLHTLVQSCNDLVQQPKYGQLQSARLVAVDFKEAHIGSPN